MPDNQIVIPSDDLKIVNGTKFPTKILAWAQLYGPHMDHINGILDNLEPSEANSIREQLFLNEQGIYARLYTLNEDDEGIQRLLDLQDGDQNVNGLDLRSFFGTDELKLSYREKLIRGNTDLQDYKTSIFTGRFHRFALSKSALNNAVYWFALQNYDKMLFDGISLPPVSREITPMPHQEMEPYAIEAYLKTIVVTPILNSDINKTQAKQLVGEFLSGDEIKPAVELFKRIIDVYTLVQKRPRGFLYSGINYVLALATEDYRQARILKNRLEKRVNHYERAKEGNRR